MKPRAIILSGYGLNCEDETAFAFETAGAKAEIVHINDLKSLKKYQILVVPGGFSFGDDTGSGKAFAHKLKAKLGDQLHEFLARDTLMAGICNGFQILTSAGILPGALTHNDSGRYISKWVEIVVENGSDGPLILDSPATNLRVPHRDRRDSSGDHARNDRGTRSPSLPSSPWLSGFVEGDDAGMEKSPHTLWVPIAHGEGKYIIDPNNPPTVSFRYVENPNGSTDDIAGIVGYDGRVLGMMPHPERSQFEYQRPPGAVHKGGQGLQIFINAVNYFK